MCGIDFDLVLTNTLSKDTVLKDEMNFDSDSTRWEGEMKKMRNWVGCSHWSSDERLEDGKVGLPYKMDHNQMNFDRPWERVIFLILIFWFFLFFPIQ